VETPKLSDLLLHQIGLVLYYVIIQAVTRQSPFMPIHEQILRPQQQSQKQSDEKRAAGVESVIGNLLGLVLADDELVQAPTDLLGRREARPRRGRPSGVGVGRGRRQGEGAGAGREEAASRGEHEARGRRGWDHPPRAPPQFTSSITLSSVQLFKPAVVLFRGSFGKFGNEEGPPAFVRSKLNRIVSCARIPPASRRILPPAPASDEAAG